MAVRTLVAFAFAAAVAFAGDPPRGPADKDVKDRVDALKGAKDDVAKKKAIADAAKCPHASVAGELLGFVVEGEVQIRMAAVKALGSFIEYGPVPDIEYEPVPDLRIAANKALAGGIKANAGKPDVVKAIFSAMAKVGNAAAVPTLKDFAAGLLPFKDEKAPSDLVVASIDALVAIKRKASVEALIALNKLMTETATLADQKTNKLVSQRIEKGLKTLLPGLSNDFGGDDWQLWWNKNKATFNDDLTPKK